jgi:hypothetical protein
MRRIEETMWYAGYGISYKRDLYASGSIHARSRSIGVGLATFSENKNSLPDWFYQAMKKAMNTTHTYQKPLTMAF